MSAALCFTAEDADRASDEWGFNCGPGALCAALSMTPNTIRPHLLDFESKGYTNPTLMLDELRRLGKEFHLYYRADEEKFSALWPMHGLVRIQWGGPWTKPGVPMRARYRQTHWIASRKEHGYSPPEIFDINAMSVGGWITYEVWARKLIPWLIKECVPKGNGRWWPTHCLEVKP